MTPKEYKVTSVESIEFGYKICLELSETDRYEFILSPEQYKEYGTKAGETINEEIMQAMRTDMQFYSAVRRAYDILSYGENTKNQLIYKLVKRGFKRPLAIQVAEYMKEKGYIDEREQLLSYSNQLATKKYYGRERILSEVVKHGFERDYVESILMESLKEVDFVENCAYLIRRKYGQIPKDINEYKKMIASLVRYGYSISEVKLALRRVSKDATQE
jgi:regulatory protein